MSAIIAVISPLENRYFLVDIVNNHISSSLADHERKRSRFGSLTAIYTYIYRRRSRLARGIMPSRNAAH